MQTDILPTGQLTVHLVDSATMTWAVAQNGNQIYEGSMQSCEEFLDWVENHPTQHTQRTAKCE
ncbi:MAG: hypothetical protein ACKVHE_35805 [Planctomycetales bacterium]|jgi:hypothetical protein